MRSSDELAIEKRGEIDQNRLLLTSGVQLFSGYNHNQNHPASTNLISKSAIMSDSKGVKSKVREYAQDEFENDWYGAAVVIDRGPGREPEVLIIPGPSAPGQSPPSQSDTGR